MKINLKRVCWAFKTNVYINNLQYKVWSGMIKATIIFTNAFIFVPNLTTIWIASIIIVKTSDCTGIGCEGPNWKTFHSPLNVCTIVVHTGFVVSSLAPKVVYSTLSLYFLG